MGSVKFDWVPERLKAKAWRGEEFRYAHAKVDGWCIAVVKQSDGCTPVYGREHLPSMELTRRFPTILDAEWYDHLEHRMPRTTCVYGELVAPGGRASDVPTALKTGEGLRFLPFAIPVMNGVDQSMLDLVQVNSICKNGLGLHTFLPYLHIDAIGPCHQHVGEKVEECLLRLARERGYEGWMLKTHNYHGWWKLKPQLTLDGVVTGAKPGKGKYVGMVGSIEVSVWEDGDLRTVASVSGMTDAERVRMTNLDVDSLLAGRVCEVMYQYVGSKGRLRHPRFVRWREDKSAAQCTSEQLE